MTLWIQMPFTDTVSTEIQVLCMGVYDKDKDVYDEFIPNSTIII